MNGDLLRAEILHREALSMMERTLLPDDPRIAEVLFNLSAVVGGQRGRLGETENILHRCLDAQKRLHGVGEFGLVRFGLVLFALCVTAVRVLLLLFVGVGSIRTYGLKTSSREACIQGAVVDTLTLSRRPRLLIVQQYKIIFQRFSYVRCLYSVGLIGVGVPVSTSADGVPAAAWSRLGLLHF